MKCFSPYLIAVPAACPTYKFNNWGAALEIQGWWLCRGSLLSTMQEVSQRNLMSLWWLQPREHADCKRRPAAGVEWAPRIGEQGALRQVLLPCPVFYCTVDPGTPIWVGVSWLPVLLPPPSRFMLRPEGIIQTQGTWKAQRHSSQFSRLRTRLLWAWAVQGPSV